MLLEGLSVVLLLRGLRVGVNGFENTVCRGKVVACVVVNLRKENRIF